MTSPTVIDTPVPVYAGDTTDFFTYTFKTDGTPTDMSEWAFSAEWRPNATSDVVLPLIVDDSDAASGVINISAAAEVTAQMTSAGVYDLQGINSTETRTFLRGKTTFTPDVTR